MIVPEGENTQMSPGNSLRATAVIKRRNWRRCETPFNIGLCYKFHLKKSRSQIESGLNLHSKG